MFPVITKSELNSWYRNNNVQNILTWFDVRNAFLTIHRHNKVCYQLTACRSTSCCSLCLQGTGDWPKCPEPLPLAWPRHSASRGSISSIRWSGEIVLLVYLWCRYRHVRVESSEGFSFVLILYGYFLRTQRQSHRRTGIYLQTCLKQIKIHTHMYTHICTYDKYHETYIGYISSRKAHLN